MSEWQNSDLHEVLLIQTLEDLYIVHINILISECQWSDWCGNLTSLIRVKTVFHRSTSQGDRIKICLQWYEMLVCTAIPNKQSISD